MSKQKKEQQKKKKREQKRKERLGKYRAMLTALGRDDGFLEHISDLMREGEHEEARGMLFEYVEKYPKVARAFSVLATVCATMKDTPGMFWAAERLLEVGQRTLEDYTLYHTACIANDMLAVLVACEEQMQRRFPVRGKEDITVLREELLTTFKRNAAVADDDLTPYTDEDLLALMRGQEMSTLYLGSQRFDLAIQICDEMIARFPFYTSPYNNKSLAILYDRGPDAAESFLQHSLELHPDNLFAIAFKIRQLALLGRHEELPGYCKRLADLPMKYPNPLDFYIGKIEAFAWADDLERIVELYPHARKEIGEEWDITRPTHAQTTHYVAVAHARLGDRETAVKLWKSIPPGTLEIAAENLEDIQKPIGEQNGPWFFETDHWIPKQFFTILRQESRRAGINDQDEKRDAAKFERYVKAHFKRAFTLFPSFESTLAEILQRGGPKSRDFVRLFVGMRETPKFKAAALEFALGQSGSDTCRNDLVVALMQSQWLNPKQPFRFWREGEWRELETFNTEIYSESKEWELPLSPQGHEMAAEANELAHKGKYKQAIKLLTEVNEKEPGRAPVLYNIAVFHKALGDEETHDNMIDDLAEQFPNYFFIKNALARRLIQQKRFDEALKILAPLQKLERMHISEFKTLYGTLIFCHLVKGNIDTAKSIYDIAAGTVGDEFPAWETFQREV